jgi:hypothetical protein
LRQGKETEPTVEAFARYEPEEFHGTLVVKSSESWVEADSKTKGDGHCDGDSGRLWVGQDKKAVTCLATPIV